MRRNRQYYRNKSQYPVSADGRVGFTVRTHQVTNLDACLIQKPQADAAAGSLRLYMAKYRVPGYDEKTGTGLVRHLYVRTNAKGSPSFAWWQRRKSSPERMHWWRPCARQCRRPWA